MSNLARKLQQEQEQQTVSLPHKRKKVRIWLSPGETILGVMFFAAFIFASVHIISNQAAIYELNKETQETTSLMQKQVKLNNELEMQIGELSTHERIREKAAELGLKLNENNVKVVQE